MLRSFGKLSGEPVEPENGWDKEAVLNMSIATVAKGKGIFIDSASENDQHGPINICAKFYAFITNWTILVYSCTLRLDY